MKKKYGMYALLGALSWILIFSGFFKWLDVPTFDNILTNILGESSAFNDVLAFITASTLIVLVVLGTSKFIKRIEKTQ